LFPNHSFTSPRNIKGKIAAVCLHNNAATHDKIEPA
jgi:hypothetical protein